MDIVNIIAALGGWELVRFVLNYLFYRRREGESPSCSKKDFDGEAKPQEEKNPKAQEGEEEDVTASPEE